MRKTILLACLLLVLLVSVLFAPPNEKAEKVRIDSLTWDGTGQQFELEMSCKFGMATAGEHADFKVGTTLLIDIGDGTTSTAEAETAIRKEPGATKDGDGYVKIDSLEVP